MLLDIRGVDFLRLQKTSKTRVGNPLADEVLFSGAYRDLCLFKQVAVSSSGPVASSGYNISYGKTMTNAPLVLGTLKLTADYKDLNNNTSFLAGDSLCPILNTYYASGQGQRIGMRFTYNASTTGIALAIQGFNGVASFLILELD